MIIILLYFLLILSYLSIFNFPYFPILVYYLFAVLQPQAIWWWAFGTLRASFITALAAIIGFIISFLQNPDFSVWKHKEVFCLLALWLWVALSIFFGGLPCQFSGAANSNALWLITELSKMFLMSLICIYLIDDSKKILYLAIVIIVSVIYLSYWGNMQYLTGAIWRNPLGRLKGPYSFITHSGVYREENCFGMFFVTTLPFLYYFVLLLKNKWIRLFLLPWIPLGWSAIFLTASRGALLGLTVTVLHVVVRFKKKFIGILLVIALVVFFLWQGGSVMKQRADTLDNPESAGRLRLTSWQLALDMMRDYPLFGIGLGNFMKARRLYGNNRRLIAMNTPLQFGAECGIPAMLFLIGMTFFALKDLLKLSHMIDKDSVLYPITLATEGSLWGVMVCGFFLSAHLYEPFYLFIAMAVILKNIVVNNYSTVS